jgi:hypothetical protein
VFKKIFALALVLVLVAICTRRPFDVRTSERLPNTCNAQDFSAMVETFDGLRFNQSVVLERIEKLPLDEPLEYVINWQREQAILKDLAARAGAVREPRCLTQAKSLFLRYLEETLKAVELRAPDKDFTDYRRARESADSIDAQYRAELKLQEANRQ